MNRSLRLRTVKIKLNFPQQIVEEHEHVRDTTHPPKHYGRIYVTRSLYEVTFPMSYRNVGSSCPHYRERRRSPHRTDSDALYAVGGGNTGPASSVTTNSTPYSRINRKTPFGRKGRTYDVLSIQSESEMVQKKLGKSDNSPPPKKRVWLSGRLHIEGRLNEGPRLQRMSS